MGFLKKQKQKTVESDRFKVPLRWGEEPEGGCWPEAGQTDRTATEGEAGERETPNRTGTTHTQFQLVLILFSPGLRHTLYRLFFHERCALEFERITLNRHHEILLALSCLVEESKQIAPRQSLHRCYRNEKQNFVQRIYIQSAKAHFKLELCGCICMLSVLKCF